MLGYVIEVGGSGKQASPHHTEHEILPSWRARSAGGQIPCCWALVASPCRKHAVQLYYSSASDAAQRIQRHH